MKQRIGYAIVAIGSAIGIGFTVKDIYESTQIGLPTSAWQAIGAALFIIGVLAIIHYRSPQKEVQLQTSNVPKTKLTDSDYYVVRHLNTQMHRLHGHDDNQGITSDMLNGIDPDNILERKCSWCGKRRNEKGGPYG